MQCDYLSTLWPLVASFVVISGRWVSLLVLRSLTPHQKRILVLAPIHLHSAFRPMSRYEQVTGTLRAGFDIHICSSTPSESDATCQDHIATNIWERRARNQPFGSVTLFKPLNMGGKWLSVKVFKLLFDSTCLSNQKDFCTYAFQPHSWLSFESPRPIDAAQVFKLRGTFDSVSSGIHCNNTKPQMLLRCIKLLYHGSKSIIHAEEKSPKGQLKQQRLDTLDGDLKVFEKWRNQSWRANFQAGQKRKWSGRFSSFPLSSNLWNSLQEMPFKTSGEYLPGVAFAK